MQVTVQNENAVVVDVQQQETIIVEVDQGRAGRGIETISYQQQGQYYYLVVTYTDGTTETLGPLIITGAAASLLGGTTGAIAYQTAPDTTGFLALGTANQVVVAGASAPQYTSALTGLTVNNSAIGNTTPSTGAFTNLSASGTFALTGDQVQISEGGTGQTTANAAFNALAPSQTGNAGKYLKTDGTNSSWDQLDISTADITGVLPVANGGTGASTAAGARANLSAAILGANNDITSLTGITGGISTPDFVQFDTAATNTNAVGKVYWDAAQGTLDLGLLGGNVISRIGQSLVAYVTNAEAVTITKGQVVYLFSAQGDRATVKLAYNTSDATSAKTFGVVAENIPANGTGFVMCQGVLEGLNLGAFTAGDTLYLGATPGSLTATKPAAPNHLVYVGLVERANPGNGQLYVKVQNGYELDEIHDVQIVNPQNGQTILYDASTSLWKNANLTAGSGISVTNGAASVTIGNTGVLSFSGGTTGLTPSASTTGAVTLGGTLAVTNGGTGATTAAGALTNLNAASQSTTISAGTGLTGGGNLSANRTLSIANTTVTAGAYGSASNTLTATVNAQGQLTALAATPIAIANTQISGLGTMSTQNSNSVTITGGSITGITDLAIADGGTGASDAPTARTNLGLGTSATLNAGVALGVATLDAGGTVPLTQLPASIQGGVSYQGSWNAATNTPTIVSGVGSKGYYYVVSVAGSTNIDGITDWLPGDWIIFNGTIWQKIDNTDAVASVNGYTGVVVLSAADVGAPPTSRTISAGTGLTGGGDLSTNRTLSIANTTVAAGSYGSASSVGTFTVNGQGQLTAAASTPIAITNTQVSGLGTMSTQNANAVAITGGSIDGVTIGGSTTGAGSFTTLTTSSTVTLNGGTANGVAYLNGSKVLTTGSALTFDGTNLSIGSASSAYRLVTSYSAPASFTNAGGDFTQMWQASGTNALGVALSTGDTTARFVTNNGYVFAWNFAAAEQMRLNTTGLGIGTSSPAAKLHAVNTVAEILRFDRTGVRNWGYSIFADGRLSLVDVTANAERLVTDTSGNLGLGVTPSAWSGYKALQIGAYLNLAYNSGASIFAANNYWSGTNWLYQNTNYASQYQQFNGQHIWLTAPSGTAGNAISWTQAMTLDASGSLAIGQTSSALQSGGTGITLYGSSNSEIKFLNSSTGSAATDGTALLTSSLNFLINNREAGAITFGTSNTERARLDSSGNLGIGTSSPTSGYKLTLATGGISLTGNQATAGVTGAIDTQAYYMGNSTYQYLNIFKANGLGGGLVSQLFGGYFQISTAASVYTTTEAAGVAVGTHIKGAGSTITTAMGVDISDQTVGTNNYGLRSQISSGANKYNIYANGTAQNYFEGNVGIGTSSPTAKLSVSGNQTITGSIFSGAGSTGLFMTGSPSDFSYGVYRDGTNTIRITTASVDRVIVDSSGNVGIGTSSPNYIATLYKASLPVLQLANSTSGSTASDGLLIYLNGANATISNEEAGSIGFQTSGILRATLDSSGNLGLGVTPSAWAGKAFQIGNTSNSGWASIGYDANGKGFFATSAYNNTGSSWVYTATGFAATLYSADFGTHKWFTAPSGTAGNAISWTQAMTLSASGGLSVGTTSDAGTGNILLNANGKLCGNAPSGGTSSTIELYNSSTGNMSLTAAFSGAAITFATGGTTERARITSGGNLALGSTTTTTLSGYQWFRVNGTTGGVIEVTSNNSRVLQIQADGTSAGAQIQTITGSPLIFGTNATERARITSGGYFKASNAGSYVGSTGSYHELVSNEGSATAAVYIRNTNATSPAGIDLSYSAASPNGTGNTFLYCQDSTALRASIRSNGGIANYQANDVNLSDQRLKTDVQPAGTYLDKICAVPVKTFLYKDQSDTERNLGVMAQDVDAVAPELIDHSGFGEAPEGESPYLAVYQTDLQYALMKCIQELKAELDSVKAELATLKGN